MFRVSFLSPWARQNFLPLRQSLFLFFSGARKFCLAIIFFTSEAESVPFFSGAGKFCLAHGLTQLTRDVKSEVRTLNFRSDVAYLPTRKTPNDVRSRSLSDQKCEN